MKNKYLRKRKTQGERTTVVSGAPEKDVREQAAPSSERAKGGAATRAAASRKRLAGILMLILSFVFILSGLSYTLLYNNDRDGSFSGEVPVEAITFGDDMFDYTHTATIAAQWKAAVDASVAGGGTPVTFQLTENWGAVNNSFSGVNNNSIATRFYYGALYLPANANITLDLNGYVISRRGGAGGIIQTVAGSTLNIIDSSMPTDENGDPIAPYYDEEGNLVRTSTGGFADWVSDSGAAITNNGTVTMSGGGFYNGRDSRGAYSNGITFRTVTDGLTVTNAIFMGIGTGGEGMLYSGPRASGSATFNGCVFTGNSNSSLLSTPNVGNTSGSNNFQINFNNCKFVGNTNTSLFSMGASRLNLNGCLIKGNRSTSLFIGKTNSGTRVCTSAGFSCVNTDVIENTFTSTYGAIYPNGVLNILSFNGGRVANNNFPVVFITQNRSSVVLQVRNATFENNNSSGSLITTGNGTTVTNCTFDGNTTTTATTGSAILSSGTATITDCTFTNHASGYAPIYATATTGITNCTFEGNSGTQASAIYSTVAPAIYGSTFKNNLSSPYVVRSTVGVQLYGTFTQDEEGNDIVYTNEFSGNTVTGSLIYGTAVGVRWTNFKDENVGSGAIQGTGAITVNWCNFDGITASAGGASAIYATGGAITLSNSTFTNNKGNAAPVRAEAGCSVTDCTFEGNSDGNRAGAIYAAGGAVSLSDVTIKNNSSKDCGAIELTGTTTLFLNNVEITNNTAPYAAVWLNNTSSFSGMNGKVVIKDNVADPDSSNNNLYIGSNSRIPVLGDMAGSEVYVARPYMGFLTTDFGQYNPSIDPTDVFKADTKLYEMSNEVDVSSGYLEAYLFFFSNANVWERAVQQSLAAGGAPKTVQLVSDWDAQRCATAISGTGANAVYAYYFSDNLDCSTAVGFTNTTTGKNYGALFVPAGANIILDLNGFTINRHQASAIAVGSVIIVGTDGTNGGILTIKDTSAAQTGVITGGNDNSNYCAGGVSVLVGGTLRIEGGSIQGNYAQGNANFRAGGVGLWWAKSFSMTGGSVKDNYVTSTGSIASNKVTTYSNMAGGILAWYTEEISLIKDCEISGNQCTGNYISNTVGGLFICGGCYTNASNNLILQNVTISNNRANVGGLAISIPGESEDLSTHVNAIETTIKDCKINGNYSSVPLVGGFSFWAMDPDDVLNVTDTNINGNYVSANTTTYKPASYTYSTGGAYIACPEINLTNVNIKNNSSTHGPGGLTVLQNTAYFDSVASLKNCEISDNTGTQGYGGGLQIGWSATGYNYHVDITLENCHVDGNSGGYAGGVCLEHENTFTMKGGSISNNTGTLSGSYGGLLVRSQCTVLLDKDDSGKGVSIDYNTTGTTANSTGGVWIGPVKSFIMKGGSVSHNTASAAGTVGGLSIGLTMADCYIEFDNTAIDYNEGTVASAFNLYVSGDGTATGEFVMKGGSISHNTVLPGNANNSNYHGTFVATTNVAGEKLDLRFERNDLNQGTKIEDNEVNITNTSLNSVVIGLYITAVSCKGDITLTMDAASVSRNTASSPKSDAALCAYHVRQVTLTDTVINDNRGGVVGGIDLGGYDSAITITRGSISGNKSLGGGMAANWAYAGGIALSGNANNPSLSLTLTDVEVNNNQTNSTAGGAGGILVFNQYCTFNMTGGSISGNTYTNTNATYGVGGIWFNHTSELVLKDVDLIGNKVENAPNGCVVAISANNALKLEDCTITDNEGAISSIYVNGDLSINHCDISRNIVGFSTVNNYANIYSAGVVTITNASTISGNSGGNFGTIYAKNGAEIKDSTIDNNVSAGWSGGIYLAGGESTFENVKFRTNISNHANGAGAIYLIAGGLTMDNVTISTMNRGAKAGAIYANGTVNLYGCEISGNVSYGANSSAGIYAASTDAILHLENTKILNNTANISLTDTFSAGGIYVNMSARLELQGNIQVQGNTYSANGADPIKSDIFAARSDNMIQVTGALQNASGNKPQIGVYRLELGVFTEGFGQNNPNQEAYSYFFSDASVSEVRTEKVDTPNWEATMISYDNGRNWAYYVNKSLQNSTTETFILYGDWVADPDANYTTSFGTDPNAYQFGALMVPKGASMIIELNGHTIDRNLTNGLTDSGRSNGHILIIGVGGQVVLQDSGRIYTQAGVNSADPTAKGKLTGGNNSTSSLGGGVTNLGTFTMRSGIIEGNYSTANTGNTGLYGGGVYTYGTFNMYGGEIKDNYGTTVGGVLANKTGGNSDCTGVFNLFGGSITDNTSTNGVGGVSVGSGAGEFNIGDGSTPLSKITIENNKLTSGDLSDVSTEDTSYQIKIGGHLAMGTKIYISRNTISKFTEGFGLYHSLSSSSTGAEDPNTYFFSDDPVNYFIITDGTNSDAEGMIMGYNNKDNWTYAVTSSLESNSTSTFILYTDWMAESNSNYTTAFGTNQKAYYHGALWVPAGASIVMDLRHHELDRNLTTARADGCVIVVEGELTIIDKVDANDTAAHSIGVIKGGNSSSVNQSGGIIVESGGKVTLQAGSIQDNVATGSNSAGAVYIAGGSNDESHFIMEGGQIINNQGFNAGGVLLLNYSGGTYQAPVFTMTGGKITQNLAQSSFTGGVRVSTEGRIELGASAYINDNESALVSDSNLYLVGTEGTVIEIIEPFNSDACIHISRTIIGKFTHDYGAQNGGSINPNTYFFSDVDGYEIGRDGYDADMEGTITCDIPAINWSYAVQTSIDNGGALTPFKLEKDWHADIVQSTYKTSFGEGVGYNQGRLYVPANASIILDLNGNTIDRYLLDNGANVCVENGSVFYILGQLIIIDSSELKDSDGNITTAGTGTITGGWSTGTGGIYNGGKLNIQAGTIKGNYSSAATNAGGVLNAGTLVMTGGKITDNYSKGYGAGVYNETTGTISVEGTAYINGNYDNTVQETSGNNADFISSNLYLKSNTAKVDVTGQIKNGAHISMMREELGLLTSNYGKNNAPTDPLTYFSSDSTKYLIRKTGIGITLEAEYYSEDNALNWTYFVKTSVANNDTQTFILSSDWTADTADSSLGSAQGTAFGYDDVHNSYFCGALWVPGDASIILDLNGHKLDRNLSGANAVDYGFVILVDGNLRIIDSTAVGNSCSGTITGGNSTSYASAILVEGSGTVYLENGNVTDNKCDGVHTNDGGDVQGAIGIESGATFVMTGGKIYNNEGDVCGGVYVQKGGRFGLGGSAQIYDNTDCDGETANIYFEDTAGTIYVEAPFTVPGTTFTVRRDAIGRFTQGYGVGNYENVTFVSENTDFIASTKGSGALLEGYMITHNNMLNWEYAVQTSLDNGGAPEDFKLWEDWNADGGVFGTKSPYYINGALYVPVGANINFDLNGYALNRGLSSTIANGYVMHIAGELTLDDMSDTQLGVFTGGNNKTTTFSAGGVFVDRNATFTMNGGHISENLASGAGGGGVYNNGTFVFNGGVIGAFTIGETSYEGNNSLAGGVYNGPYGSFTLAGGSISGNTGTNAGGMFVYNGYGSVSIESGTISNNTGISAGGIYIAGSADMTGGVISNNVATGTSISTGGGAGVYIASTGTFTMTSGTIKENTGLNGIRAYSSATLNMGGSAKVFDNKNTAVFDAEETKGQYRNVYLTSNTQRINIVEKLTSEAHIGVTRDVAGIFTKGYGLVNSDIPSNYFFSDKADSGVSSATEVTDGVSILEAAIGSPISKPIDVKGLIYDGTAQEIITGYNKDSMSYGTLPEGVTFENGKFTAVNAGRYEITFTPAEKYCWSDGTSGMIIVTCVVSPRVVELSWSHLNDLVYNGKQQVPTATVTNLAKPDDIVGITVAVFCEEVGAGIYAGTHEAIAAYCNNNNYTLVGAGVFNSVTMKYEAKAEYVIQKATLDLEITNDEAPFKTDVDIEVIDSKIGDILNVLDGVTAVYTVASGDGSLLDASKLSNGVLYALAASGSVTIRVTIPATVNTEEGWAEKTINLVKAEAKLDLVEKEVVYGDTLTLTAEGNEGEAVTFTVTDHANGTKGEAELDETNTAITAKYVGKVSITITMEENDYYKRTEVDVIVVINPRVVELEWVEGTFEFEYDKQYHVPEVKVTNPVFGDELKVLVANSQKNAGIYSDTDSTAKGPAAKASMIQNLDGSINPNYTVVGADNATHEFEIKKIKLPSLEFVEIYVPYGEELILELTGNEENASITYEIVELEDGDGTIEAIDAFTAKFIPSKVGKLIVKATVSESENYSETEVVTYIYIIKGTRNIELSSTIGTNDNGVVEVVYGDSVGFVLTGDMDDLHPDNSAQYFTEVSYMVVSSCTYDGVVGFGTISGHTFLAMESGEVQIRITIQATENYNAYQDVVTIKVVPRPVTLIWTVDPKGYVYNGSEQAPKAKVSNLAFTDDEGKVEVIVEGQINAGDSLTAVATGLQAGERGDASYNYTLDGVSSSILETMFNIDPLEIEVVWGNPSLLFNGEYQAPSYTLNGLIGDDTCELVISGKELHATPSGDTYTATATGTTNSNYKVSDPNPSVNFVIYKTSITLEILNDYVIYRSPTQIEISGNIGNGVEKYYIVAPMPCLTATIDENTGVVYASTYDSITVRVEVYATDDTYFGYVEKELQVIRGEAGTDLETKEVIYGDDLDLVVTGIDPASTVSMWLKYPSGVDFSTYVSAYGEVPDTGTAILDSANMILTGTGVGTVTVVIHTTASGMFAETTKEIVVTVLPRPLEIEWDDEFRYDGSSHILTANSVSNLAFSDTYEVLYDGALSGGGYTLSINVESSQINIGEYSATVVLSNPNYCLADYNEVLLMDTVMTSVTDEEGTVSSVPYSMIVGREYEIDFTIIKGLLTITVSPLDVYIDETPTLNISGNLGGGEVTLTFYAVSGDLSFDSSTYVITPISIGTVRLVLSIAETDNYEAVTNLEFTINVIKHDSNVTLVSATYVYGTPVVLGVTGDGSTDGGNSRDITYTVTDGTGHAVILADGETLNPLWVGTVTVHVSIAASDNYAAQSFDTVITIVPRPVILAWTLDPNGYVYDGTEKIPEASVSNLIAKNGVNDDVTVIVTGQVNAGTGLVATATGLQGSDSVNYILGSTDNTTLFTIDRAVVEYEWGYEVDGVWYNTLPIQLEYTGSTLAPKAKVTSTLFVNDLTGVQDTCEIIVAGGAIPVGSYTATASGTTNSNYRLADAPNGTEHDQDFEIIKGNPVLGLTTKEAPYGKDLELAVSGNIGNGKITFTILPIDSSDEHYSDTHGAGTVGGETGNVFTPEELGWVKVQIDVAGTANTNPSTTIAWIQVVKGEMEFEIEDDEVIYGDELEIKLDFANVKDVTSSKIPDIPSIISALIKENADGTKGKAEWSSTNPYILLAKGAGKIEVEIKVKGNDYYNDSTQTFTITIAPRTITIVSWDSKDEFTYNGKTQYPEITGLDNLASFDTLADVEIKIAGHVNAGKGYHATASASLNDNYILDVTSDPDILVSGEYKINQLVAEIEWGYYVGSTWVTTQPFEFTYTGSPQAPIAKVTNLQKNDSGINDVCTVTVSGQQTNAGGTYTATATGLSNANYTLVGTTSDTAADFTIGKAKPVLSLTYQKVNITSYNPLSFTTEKGTLVYGDNIRLILSGNIGNGDETYTLNVDSYGTLWTGTSGGNVIQFLTIEHAGSITIRVHVDETDNTLAADASLTITVQKAKRDVKILNENGVYDDRSRKIVYDTTTPLAFSGLDGLTAGVNGAGGYIVSGFRAPYYFHKTWSITLDTSGAERFYKMWALGPAGGYYYEIHVTTPATDNYEAFTKTFNIYIEKKALSIDWEKSEFIYNGKEQKPTVKLIGLASYDLNTRFKPYNNSVTYDFLYEYYTKVNLLGVGTNAGNYTVIIDTSNPMGGSEHRDIRNGNLYYYIDGSNLSYNYDIGRAEINPYITTTDAALGTDLPLQVAGNPGNGAVTYQILDGGSGSATLNGNILTPTAIGTVYVRAYVAETQNYHAAYTDITIIKIGKPYAPIDVDTLTTTYGENLTINVTNSDNEGGQILMSVENGTGSAVLNGYVLTATGAGTVTLKIMIAETASYQATTITRTVTINPRLVEIEWDPNTLVLEYNGSVQAPTAHVVSGLINGDTCDVNVSGGAISAGNYTATATSVTNPNYLLKTTAGNLSTPYEIIGIDMQVTLANKIAYIGSDLLLTLIGNVSGANPTYTIINSTGAAELSGNNTLVPLQTGEVLVRIYIPATSNTTEVDIQEIVTIKKREINIELLSDEVIYGDVLELDILGNDGEGAVHYTVTDGTGRASISDNNKLKGERAGEVTVTVTVDATNSYAEATLTQTVTVKPRPVEIEWDTSAILIYNGEVQVPTAKVKASSLVNGDICGVVEAAIKGVKDAGTDNVAEVTELDNTNYTVDGGINVTTVYTILPKPVELDWSEESFIYNGLEQVPTATVNNLVPNDAGLKLTVLVSGETFANEARNNERALATATYLSGSSNYTLDGGTNVTWQYDIEQLTAELDWNDSPTIKLETGMTFFDTNASVCWVDNLKTNALLVLDVCNVEIEVIDPNIVTFADSADSAIQSFTVKARSLSNDNYVLPDEPDDEHDVSVSALGLTITWRPLNDAGEIELVYNGYEQRPEFDVEGIEDADLADVTVVATVSESPVNVGEYTVNLELQGDKASKYTLSAADIHKNFKIVPKPVTVTASSKDVAMILTDDFSDKLLLKNKWDDWFMLACNELAVPDQLLEITDIFDAASLFVAPKFYKIENGIVAPDEINPNAVGKYQIHMSLIEPTQLICLTGNYTVTLVFEEEGVLTVSADGNILKINTDSNYQFLAWYPDSTSGRNRRTAYDEIGWTHGESDVAQDRVVLGQIKPNTTINAFLSNLDAMQKNAVRIYDENGTMVYDRGSAVGGGSTSDFNSVSAFRIGTGWRVELVSGDGPIVLDTIYLSVLGDIDGDGRITPTDVADINVYLVLGSKGSPKTIEQLLAMDIQADEDGICANDIACLNQVLIGNKIEDYYYVPEGA